MVYFFIFLFIIFSIGFVIQLVAKFLLRNFFAEKPNTAKNPYINYHKAKMQNDKNYDEYLDWLKNKDVYGTPIKKVEAPEEKEASVKVRRLVPARKFTDDDKLF